MRLKFVQAFVDKRNGRAAPFYYFRRRGYPLVRLPGMPGTREFQEVYQQALDGLQPTPIGAGRTKPGTVNAAIIGYFDSTMFFGSLSPSTQQMRRAILEKFRNEHGDRLIADLPQKFIALTLNRLKPHAARSWFKTIRHLIQYTVAVGMMKSDPTQGMRLPSARNKSYRAWTNEEIAAFEARWPIGTKARLAFALGLWTGQRKGDVIRMGRQHIRNGYLHVVQQKTKRELNIPVVPQLRTVLEATPADNLTFLVTKSGKPYRPADFSDEFRQWCDAAGLSHECKFHGLRHTTGRLLAEKGCSTHQIAAITGHTSLSMVQRYTRAAEQKRLASEAMGKLLGPETEQHVSTAESHVDNLDEKAS
jgi:integrase